MKKIILIIFLITHFAIKCSEFEKEFIKTLHITEFLALKASGIPITDAGHKKLAHIKPADIQKVWHRKNDNYITYEGLLSDQNYINVYYFHKDKSYNASRNIKTPCGSIITLSLIPAENYFGMLKDVYEKQIKLSQKS